MRLLAPFVFAFSNLLGGVGLHAQPDDPPTRVMRISAAEGSVRWLGADGSDAPADTPRAQNRPLVPGDRLLLERGARVELHSGDAALRLQGPVALYIGTLDDGTTRLRLTEGTLAVQLHALQGGERFEVGTPQLALLAQSPGRWRLDVDPVLGSTRVAMARGGVTAYGEGGQSQPLLAGPAVAFGGRTLAPATSPLPARDAFDQWVTDRDSAEATSAAARRLPREVPGTTQLDAHGDWQDDAQYGAVWLPRSLPPNWAPYRQGRWETIAPWGWTWVDDAPWGFAPFHYGRWAQLGARWAWVPGPRLPRPAYAPALVGFAGTGNGMGDSVALAQGGNGVAWFPLAPGEPWQPTSPFGAGYTQRVNRGIGEPNVAVGREAMLHQRQPHAVTAWSADRVGRRDIGGTRMAHPTTALPGLSQPDPPGGRMRESPPRAAPDGPNWRGYEQRPPVVQQQDRAWRREVQQERQADGELLQRNPRTEAERARREQLQRQQQSAREQTLRTPGQPVQVMPPAGPAVFPPSGQRR